MQKKGFRVVHTAKEATASLDEVVQDHLFIIEDSLGYRINYVAKQLARLQAASLARHGVTLGQWTILMFLWVQDGLSQGELSRQAMVEDATMVRSIDRMERDGLVQRVRNPQDRRQIHIFLTEKGQALRDVLIPCLLTVQGVAVEGFTEDEIRQFSSFLCRIGTSLEQAMETTQ